MKFLSLFVLSLSIVSLAFIPVHADDVPLFLADVPNPNAYTLFANGGWDGNWFVGYQNCWVQRIRVPEKGNFKRVYLGARLGRAKSVPGDPERPWIRKIIPGEIYVAISSTRSWKASPVIPLTTTSEISQEGDAETAADGVRESSWYWKEIPLESVRFGGDNFIALGSNSPILNSAKMAPVLAGAWGDKEADSWLIQNLQGAPPKNFNVKDWQPVTVFQPAIALKLVPEKVPPAPKVNIVKIEEETRSGKLENKIVWCSVLGESVAGAWLEVSVDGQNWQRFGQILRTAPFSFKVTILEIPMGPEGKSWVRAKAVDFYESVGTSAMVSIF